MITRDVIAQLLKYPMDAPLHVLQGNAVNPACAAEFRTFGKVLVDGKEEEREMVGFVICSEAEYTANLKAQAEAVEQEAQEAQKEAAE